jgi:hypothetical protein
MAGQDDGCKGPAIARSKEFWDRVSESVTKLTVSWYRDSDTAPQKPKKRAADNPYTGTAKKIKPREDSPVYNPPSPVHGRGEPPESPHDSDYSGNTLSGEAAARATYEEAIGFAMSAQYAAGYWLGVAHTKAKASPVSNILHTRQEHTSAKLKR